LILNCFLRKLDRNAKIANMWKIIIYLAPNKGLERTRKQGIGTLKWISRINGNWQAMLSQEAAQA